MSEQEHDAVKDAQIRAGEFNFQEASRALKLSSVLGPKITNALVNYPKVCLERDTLRARLAALYVVVEAARTLTTRARYTLTGDGTGNDLARALANLDKDTPDA